MTAPSDRGSKSTSTGRQAKERVKTAQGRSASSTRWLERQLNDPLVHEAKRLGYRARSVFKLQEMDRRHKLLRPGTKVVDLGAAPGSWSQYAAAKGCTVVAADILEMAPLAGVTFVQGDFLDEQVQGAIVAALGGPADVVLSDIAASATGQRAVDRLRAEHIGEAVLLFAARFLRPGGSCVLKLLKGAEAELVPIVRTHFSGWRLSKPDATRAESSEIYVVATDRKRIEPSGDGDKAG